MSRGACGRVFGVTLLSVATVKALRDSASPFAGGSASEVFLFLSSLSCLKHMCIALSWGHFHSWNPYKETCHVHALNRGLPSKQRLAPGQPQELCEFLASSWAAIRAKIFQSVELRDRPDPSRQGCAIRVVRPAKWGL